MITQFRLWYPLAASSWVSKRAYNVSLSDCWYFSGNLHLTKGDKILLSHHLLTLSGGCGATRPLPRDGGVEELHRDPTVGPRPKIWTRGQNQRLAASTWWCGPRPSIREVGRNSEATTPRGQSSGRPQSSIDSLFVSLKVKNCSKLLLFSFRGDFSNWALDSEEAWRIFQTKRQ